MVWGSFLIAIAAAALKTPTRNGYNAQDVNLTLFNRAVEPNSLLAVLASPSVFFYSPNHLAWNGEEYSPVTGSRMPKMSKSAREPRSGNQTQITESLPCS